MFGNRMRSYVPWVSFARHLDRLNSEFNRFFGNAWRDVDNPFPAFNIFANAEGAVMVAELPGVDIADIDVTVSGNVVTVKGSRKEADVDKAEVVRRERKTGEFARTFELPFAIEAAKVEAKSNKGVLRLVLPRAEADKPKRIEVKTA